MLTAFDIAAILCHLPFVFVNIIFYRRFLGTIFRTLALSIVSIIWFIIAIGPFYELILISRLIFFIISMRLFVSTIYEYKLYKIAKQVNTKKQRR